MKRVRLDSLAGELQHRAAQRLEGERDACVSLTAADLERRAADLFQQRRVDLGELAVLVVLEQLARQAVGAGEPACARDRLDHQQLVGGARPPRCRTARPRALAAEQPRSAAAIVATCSSSRLDSSRKRTTSWPNSACSEDPQPSYSFERRM